MDVESSGRVVLRETKRMPIRTAGISRISASELAVFTSTAALPIKIRRAKEKRPKSIHNAWGRLWLL